MYYAPGAKSCLELGKREHEEKMCKLSSKCIDTKNHSANAVCHFTLNLITVKNLITIFLLSHYLVFPLLIFLLD